MPLAPTSSAPPPTRRPPPRRRRAAIGALACALALVGAPARGEDPPAAAPPAPPARTFEVLEYRVEGAATLETARVEAALTPFLGPGRVLDDVERARAALEKAYTDLGFHSVAVAIPQQTVREGVVRLVVTEGRVGRLRVRGARWFSPRDVRLQAPSVAEGTVPNFNAILGDIVALNQIPDRRVAPAVKAGAAPGTVDVDLVVQDTLPLHGSLELNDRYGSNTPRLRLNGALRYDNLWQRGHSLGGSFLVAPERLEAARVFTATYQARFHDQPWLGLTLAGVLQDSQVTTSGGIQVAGAGRILSGRATFTLPGSGAVFQNVTVGLDLKRFQERITLGTDATRGSLTYAPASVQYGATWTRPASQTQLLAGATFNLRGLGSGEQAFDRKRFGASGSFIFYRLEGSRTQQLPGGLQLFGKAVGQYTGEALTRTPPELPAADGATTTPGGSYGESLVGSEQLTAGGSESVRGYPESHAAGDVGGVGTLELRSPSLAPPGWGWLGNLRLVAFADGAWLGIRQALPEQQSEFRLLGVGGGGRIELLGRLRGAVDAAVPLVAQGSVPRRATRVHFRIWAEF